MSTPHDPRAYERMLISKVRYEVSSYDPSQNWEDIKKVCDIAAAALEREERAEDLADYMASELLWNAVARWHDATPEESKDALDNLYLTFIRLKDDAERTRAMMLKVIDDHAARKALEE